jgi:uncharacterized protein (TIGR02246 family)
METALSQLAHRLEIQDLIVRYCVAVDDRDLDTVCDLFLPDATFSSVGDPPTGRDEIREYYAARLERYGMTYHYPHGVTIQSLTEDEATGIVLAHAELSIDGQLVVVAMRYYDRYARHEGRWVFAERRLQQFYALPHDELADGVGGTRRVRWPGAEPQEAVLPESLDSWQRFVEERSAGR